MAEKIKPPEKDKPVAKGAAKKKRFRFLLKALLALLAVLMLAGGGFAAAVYLKFVDLDALAARYKLATYPVIGRYFAKQPATNFATVDLPPEAAAEKPAPAPETAPAVQAAPAPAPAAVSTEELKAREAKAKKEEAKRISRLARLYSEMKPDEAVPILNQLDDPTVLAILGKMEDSQVAKIMSLFDARRAARLTQDMLKGKTM
ncbi:MotE family protein [Anaeroselena agilis]|uniref:Magnesium transporter MgtE n=1 Tax=Anaeroselena agilis TaxID=3063788 RepID=A0ABU3NWU6_9FIRM|nr:magnesium transporter MgtE [Selenomonadales bacterium 4137-cl]